MFSSEVGKLKWFSFVSFDLVFEVNVIYLKNKTKETTKAVTIQCVLPTRPSQDGKCHWSVLGN